MSGDRVLRLFADVAATGSDFCTALLVLVVVIAVHLHAAGLLRLLWKSSSGFKA